MRTNEPLEPIVLSEARKAFHSSLKSSVLTKDEKGKPSNADKSSKVSVSIASRILEQLGTHRVSEKLAGQMSGSKFEAICKEFVEETFPRLHNLRPGRWEIRKGTGPKGISQFVQYEHLLELERLAKENPRIASALGSDYLIKPDVIITREPEPDDELNQGNLTLGPTHSEATLTPIRKINNSSRILHASISCKWTLRSDRAQNARSEGLNLVRNRKGTLPHIAVITGEPMPSRIASIALGTGDVDCVYHFALYELQRSLSELNMGDAEELVDAMVEGRRLRDISDLPFDLAI